MINFINKTVEILAHILYNKGQANQEGLLAFYTIIEQEDKNMSLKDFDYKKGGIFAAGVLFGTAGIKALSSKDAKNLYTKAMQVHSRSMTSAQQQRMQQRLKVRMRQKRQQRQKKTRQKRRLNNEI